MKTIKHGIEITTDGGKPNVIWSKDGNIVCFEDHAAAVKMADQLNDNGIMAKAVEMRIDTDLSEPASVPV